SFWELLAEPSAIFDDIEMAHRRIWDVNPNCSDLGRSSVTRYTCFAILRPSFQTFNSLNFLMAYNVLPACKIKYQHPTPNTQDPNQLSLFEISSRIFAAFS